MEPLFKRKHTCLHEHATLHYKLDINLLDRSFHRNIALTVNIKSIKSELTRSMEQQNVTDSKRRYIAIISWALTRALELGHGK